MEQRNLLTTLMATGTNLNVTAGKTFHSEVASFVTSDHTENAKNFKVTISWGDGKTSSGMVTAVGKNTGNYIVKGSHDYSKNSVPQEVVTVLIRDIKAGATDTATATTNVTLAAADISKIVEIPSQAMEGKQLTDQIVGTFVANYKGAKASDFSANAFWGDGSPSSTATIVLAPGSKNVFDVKITHAFPLQTAKSYTRPDGERRGPAEFFITVDDPALPRDSKGNIYQFTLHSPVNITDVPLVATGTPTTINATAGQDTGFVGIGDFIDTNSLGSLYEYSATVDWGDNTPVSQIKGSLRGVGPFLGTPDFVNIAYHHKYADTGSFPITIMVHDGGDSTLVLHSTANVTALTSTFQTIPRMVFENRSPPHDPPLNNGNRDSFDDLAYFSGPPGETLGDYTFTVNWGDGVTTPAKVVQLNMAGQPPYAAIVADHTYASGGTPDAPDHRTIVVTATGPGISASSPLTSTTIANVYQTVA